jgi:hypothetical protein
VVPVSRRRWSILIRASSYRLSATRLWRVPGYQ